MKIKKEFLSSKLLNKLIKIDTESPNFLDEKKVLARNSILVSSTAIKLIKKKQEEVKNNSDICSKSTLIQTKTKKIAKETIYDLFLKYKKTNKDTEYEFIQKEKAVKQLLKLKRPVLNYMATKGSVGYTVMWIKLVNFIKEDKVKEVKKILDKKPLYIFLILDNISNIQEFGRGITLLMLAMKYNSLKTLKYLLYAFPDENEININKGTTLEKTALHIGAHFNSTSSVRELIRYKTEIYKRDINGNNSFVSSVVNQSYEVFLCLLPKMSVEEINKKNKVCFTILHFLALNKRTKPIYLEQLMATKKGLDFKGLDLEDRNPIMIAIQEGNYYFVKTVLKEYDVEITSRDIFNNNIMHLAVKNTLQNSYRDTIHLLNFIFAKYEDVDFKKMFLEKNDAGLTPLDLALRNFKVSIAQYFLLKMLDLNIIQEDIYEKLDKVDCLKYKKNENMRLSFNSIYKI